MATSKYAANRFVYGVGALVLIGLLGLVAVTANQSRLPWTEPTLVRAKFENIGQLQVGSEVRQNGLRIGQVNKIDVPDGKPVVTMAVNNAEPMYRDGYAGIYDQSSLALKFVELRSGNPASGLLGDAVLPVSQTESTHDLVDVLNIFDPVTRQALSNSLRQIGGGMAGYGPGLHDLTGSLPSMLDDARTVSATLVSARTDFPALLRSTDRLVTRFAGREAQLNSLLSQTDVTLRAIGTDDGKPLGATLATLPGTLRAARGALDSANPPLADMETATGALRPGAGGLGRATPDVRRVFTEAPRPFGKVPDFADEAKPSIDDLQETFADLQPFVPRLGEGLHQADRSLKVYKPYARDVGTALTNLGSSLSLHQGWTHQLRVYLVPPTLTSVNDAPIADAKDPYPTPGQAYLNRDKDGAFMPGDIGARKAGK